MREVRIILCAVTYDDAVLAITNCDNKELQQICDIVYKNNESGIGKYYSDVCKELYPDNLFKQLADTGEVDMIEPLKDIECQCVANTEDVTISVVRSSDPDEELSGGSEYAYLDRKWEELEDVLFVENKDGVLVLNDDWFAFSKGSTQEEIWEFFGKQHPDGLNHFIEG